MDGDAWIAAGNTERESKLTRDAKELYQFG
jgi:hypothetical protein